MKCIITFICMLFLAGYSQAQYLSEISLKLHQPQDLKKDVDFVKRKLENEHVNLYKYISKKQLNYKFDSLKKTITVPLISLKFNAKLMSVLSTIGDGHLQSGIDAARLTPADLDTLKKPNGLNPVYLFEYKIIGNRMYIIKNKTNRTNIAPGTEVLSINHQPAAKIIDTLFTLISSDGYNQTFKKFVLNSGQFSDKLSSTMAIQDSVTMALRDGDSTGTQVFRRFKTSAIQVDSGALNQPSAECKFLSPDNNIAYLKVRTFYNNPGYKGYHEFFKAIKRAGAKVLILDLRGNTGGSVGWAGSLYSFLIDKPLYFFERPESLTKKYLIPGLNKLRDRQIEFYKTYGFIAPVVPDSNAFKGKLYVLIDGGSFSATSLLIANIKKLGKALFVGEETGGSRNIWSAGIMKSEVLSNSQLTLTYGIIPFSFGDTTDTSGRGTMPDISIAYTIEEFLAKKDLEVDWVLKDIAKNLR